MKKMVGISIMSSLLILGQPFLALADTADSKVLNFGDIESIVAKQNINVQINENDKLKTDVSYADLKKKIKDLEDDLDKIDNQKDLVSGDPASAAQAIALGAQKVVLVDTLKQLERTEVDRPTLEAIADLSASMNNDLQTLSAENLFILYNKSTLDSADVSADISMTQKQIGVMELQESLGMASSTDLNDLRTKLVADQTKLDSIKYQQDAYLRQLKNLLNDQDDNLVLGSVPTTSDNFSIADKDADFKKAEENSYTIKLQEKQIVILQNTLDRANKDYGMSSKAYKQANYDLSSANLKLQQLKDTLKSDYNGIVDNIANLQNNLRLAQQSLADKKVKLSEAQLKMSLGLISKLDLDKISNDYQVQEDLVKTSQIGLFSTIRGYGWFLRGMPKSS